MAGCTYVDDNFLSAVADQVEISAARRVEGKLVGGPPDLGVEGPYEVAVVLFVGHLELTREFSNFSVRQLHLRFGRARGEDVERNAGRDSV